MNKVFSILIIVLLWGCNNSQNKIIIAQNNGKDLAFSGVTRLELDKTNRYVLSYTPHDTTFSKARLTLGEYRLKNDTIYLYENDNTGFKKAILKHGYFEILDDCYKIKLVENKTFIVSKSELRDNNDFTFFTYNKSFESVFPKGLSTDLNDSDIIKIMETIQRKMNDERKRFNKPPRQEEYFKQCVAIINSKNEKIVWINCIAKKVAKFSDWENEIRPVMDGGDAYFTLKINLTTGEIYDFYVHGQA
jgi:hypothetical protein